jgi:membrane protein
MCSALRSPVVAARRRVADLRARHPMADHLHRAGDRFIAQRGNHLASAVAFATVLASTPLLMVLFSAAGFLLWLRADLLAELESWIVDRLPASLDGAAEQAIEAAVSSRGPIASVGTLVALWAGTIWISVVREALSAMWKLPPRPPASPRRIVRDLGSLLVLLVALALSVTFTVSATTAVGLLAERVGLADRTPIRVLLGGGGVVLGWAIAWAVVTWLLGRLPGHTLPLRSVLPVAAVGALAIEAIAFATTLTVGATSGSVSEVVFATALAGLVFLFAAARILLSLAAWLATSPTADRTFGAASTHDRFRSAPT